jgi:Cu/Zn superoxide dismutase
VHVHERGDCSTFDALSAGPHWNPAGATHGLPDGGVHHAGDIGNMQVGADGRGSLTFTSPYWTLIGMDSVLGHALVVHQGIDDGVSQPAGDAGARAGCGLITLENQQPRAPRVLEVRVDPKSGTSAAARLTLTETGNAITALLDLYGVPQGQHLVQLHDAPDCSAADALSAGPVWGVPPNVLGTVTAAANGTGRLVAMNPRWQLADGGITIAPMAADGGIEDRYADGGFVRYDLAGHAVIIRAGTGADAGARISCGVIR